MFVLLKAYHYTTKTTILKKKTIWTIWLSSADYFERPAAQRGEPQHRHCVDNEKVTTNLEFSCALIDVICLYSMTYSMFFCFVFSPGMAQLMFPVRNKTMARQRSLALQLHHDALWLYIPGRHTFSVLKCFFFTENKLPFSYTCAAFFFLKAAQSCTWAS